MKYPFEYFNPAQSAALEYREQDVNLVCAFPTGAGKTAVAELVMDHALRSGRKALYTSPLKALSQERYDEWREEAHPFSKYKVSILTGDYILTPARVGELQAADIIILTSEMLDSKCRRMKAEKNEWLLQAGCLVIDEMHLLGVEHRGDSLESGLMRFTQHNRWARLVLLSATVANSPEMRDWVEKLNGKQTVLIRSDYRPCPLRVHLESYDDSLGYYESEASKQALAIQVMESYPDDRFLFFVHTKKAGWNLLNALNRRNLKVAFHNSEVSRADRLEIEEAFREGRIDHIIATSTLAMGMNLPARRVCILGTNRGLSEVHELEILQEVGRAGRPGYDDRGDAHVLVPESKLHRESERFSRLPWVESQMKTPGVLAFHVISEIERGDISTEDDLIGWYNRSFAVHQSGEVSEELLETVVERLKKRDVVDIDRDGFYRCLPTCKIASWYYFSPLDMADWRDNFGKIASDKDPDEYAIAWALTHVFSRLQMDGYCPRDLVTRARFLEDLYFSRGLSFDSNLVVHVEAVFQRLSGKDLLASYRLAILDILTDHERLLGALQALSKNTKLFFFPPEFWKLLGLRLQYGVAKEAAPFCLVKGIGTKRATALLQAGFKSFHDIWAHPDMLREVLGPKLAERLLEETAKVLGKTLVRPQGELFDG
jgi:helicase